MLSKLKQLFAQDTGQKQMRPLHYLIILFAIGAALMILTDFFAISPDQPSDELSLGPAHGSEPLHTPVIGGGPVDDNPIREYEHAFERQLEEILQEVIGVGEVDVMVNLDSTPEYVFEKNREQRTSTLQETDKDKATRDQNEQSRNEQVVIIQGKQEQPLMLKTRKPQVRGVLVVAKGAENVQVKAWITEAVQRVLDVPAYKISVLPKKG